MKNVYIISRFVTPQEPSVIHMPILGVCGSKLKANAHIEEIILDRVRQGYMVVWDRNVNDTNYDRKEIRNILFEKGINHEYLYLEQTKV